MSSHDAPFEFGARMARPGQTPRVVRNPRSASTPYTRLPISTVCPSGSSKIVNANRLPSGHLTGMGGDVAHDRVDRAEVLDRQIALIDLQAEALFEPHDQLHDGG